MFWTRRKLMAQILLQASGTFFFVGCTMGLYSDGKTVFLLRWVTIWTILTWKQYSTCSGMAGKCISIWALVTERLNHKQRRAHRRQQAHEQHQSRKQFEDQGAFSAFGDDNSSCLPLRWGVKHSKIVSTTFWRCVGRSGIQIG